MHNLHVYATCFFPSVSFGWRIRQPCRIVDTDKFEDFPLVGRLERRGSDVGDKIWDVYGQHLGEGGERKLLEQQLGPL